MPSERILECARELFWKQGTKSITMDEIARTMGISKKTIYRYYTDKDQIVREMASQLFQTQGKVLDDLTKNSKNAVDEIISIMKHMGDLFCKINPILFYDLQKFHPDTWKVFREFKETYALGMIERNLKRGMTEGLYREDINVKILARLRMHEVEMAMDPDLFPADKFNLLEVHFQLIGHFLHGVATLKGHKLINKYKKFQEAE